MMGAHRPRESEPEPTSQPVLTDLLWPGNLVQVVWWGGDRSRHRVVTVEPGRVIVSGGRETTDQPLMLVWGSDRGEHRVGVAEASYRSYTAEWWMNVDPDVHVSQRRNFARADAAVPVVIATEHGMARGNTVDVGEGGLCCVVHQGPLPAPGEQVKVKLGTGEVDCLVPAVVVRVLPGTDGRPAFAVRFLDPNPAGKWLRRQVLRWQINARKVSDR